VVTQDPEHLLMEVRQPRGIIFGLSTADLRHEWILTLCLVMAIAAVLSPLLLLFGLKYGTIETLRHRLIQDPRNRDIRPMTSRSFSSEWFAQLRQRSDVGFLIPMTRQISATVTAVVKGRSDKGELDILPTAAHDPLLLENAAPIPGPGECVLTHFAAEALQAQIGDTLVATARRIKAGQYESGNVELRIVGVLSLRASDLKSMYVPLEILEAVERYKDGEAVPKFGWAGTTPAAYPQYDGLVVVLPRQLSKLEEYSLYNNTGFTKIDAITPAELTARTQVQIAADVALYFLSTQRKPVGAESIETVRQKLRGQDATLLPWVAPLKARLLRASGEEIAALELYPLSIDAAQAEALQLTPVPPWGAAEMERQIMLPSGITVPAESVSLQIVHDKTELTFPISPVAARTTSATAAFLPVQLGGILHLHQQRTVMYAPDLNAFVLSRRGYAGFRLYAKTIDEVDGLRRYFDEGQGIPVHTEAQRITDVTDLDTYLTLIFWFIAAVGVVGGTTALVASLYASVERKKRELGVLRLLGLPRLALFRYPVYQGMVIGAGGFVVAMLFFYTMATVINRLFGAHLGAGESFCKLPFPQACGALLATLLTAILASTWAAWRVTRIEPAEALRDE
jgi:putative ABC transport system permease protein